MGGFIPMWCPVAPILTDSPTVGQPLHHGQFTQYQDNQTRHLPRIILPRALRGCLRGGRIACKVAFKGAQSRLNGLKSLTKLFNFFKSVSIFSILNHPCSFMHCYNLLCVFLSL